jgi:hypothetical protein
MVVSHEDDEPSDEDSMGINTLPKYNLSEIK